MKKWLILLVFLLAACEPNDFPPPPPDMTVIVELPPVTAPPPTPTYSPQFISREKMADAETFFLLLKTSMAAGDDSRIATLVNYPLNVKVDGQMTTMHSAAELQENYAKIFTPTVINALTGYSETDLVNLPDGIRVGNGEIWLGLFCPDAACKTPLFLISRINN